MTIEEMRARAGEISDSLAKLEGVENFSDSDIANVNDLNEEFSNLKKQIEAKEKISAVTAQVVAPNRKVVVPRIEVVEPKNGGFKTAGEFFMAVKSASQGRVDSRFNNTAFEKVGEDGGFLVPEEYTTEIMKKLSSDESLLSKTRQFSVNGNSLTLPTNETAPWSGGIQAYWTGEGMSIAESKAVFGQASLKLNKLAALVKVTDELLEDAVAMESYIKAMAPEAIMHKVNSAIISGNGVAKPQGILGSSFAVTVSKESGQTADTVVSRNVINMHAKMLPMSRANAAWFINAAVEPQLLTMKDDNNNFIYLAPGSQMNQTPYGVLLGRPVISFIGSMPALGDLGDIVFADLSYYYTILKSGGVQNAISTHLFFDQSITAYRWTLRLDGKCPFKSPITTEFGSYTMSAIVLLEAR